MNNNKIIEWLNKSRLIVVLYIVLVIIILFSIFSENIPNSMIEKFSQRTNDDADVTTQATNNSKRRGIRDACKTGS